MKNSMGLRAVLIFGIYAIASIGGIERTQASTFAIMVYLVVFG